MRPRVVLLWVDGWSFFAPPSGDLLYVQPQGAGPFFEMIDTDVTPSLGRPEANTLDAKFIYMASSEEPTTPLKVYRAARAAQLP